MSTPPAVSWSTVPTAFELGGGLLRFAHHPHCDRHLHHLIWVRGRPLCLGCTAMAAGVPIGLLAAVLIPWGTVPAWLWIGGHAAFVLPTALQPLIQTKAFKITARVMLGAVTASYFISGLWARAYFSNEWLWRACVLAAFAAGFAALYTWRQRRTNNPCETCPLGTFPTCDWNMPRLLEANADNPLWIKIAEDHAQQQSAHQPIGSKSLRRNNNDVSTLCKNHSKQ